MPHDLSAPTFKVTGAARLHRAASSDRRERGRPQGWPACYKSLQPSASQNNVHVLACFAQKALPLPIEKTASNQAAQRLLAGPMKVTKSTI